MRKRTSSDQRIAELQALIALVHGRGNVAHGQLDPALMQVSGRALYVHRHAKFFSLSLQSPLLRILCICGPSCVEPWLFPSVFLLSCRLVLVGAHSTSNSFLCDLFNMSKQPHRVYHYYPPPYFFLFQFLHLLYTNVQRCLIFFHHCYVLHSFVQNFIFFLFFFNLSLNVAKLFFL